MRRYFFVPITALLFIFCNKREEVSKNVIGQWSITSIEFAGYNYRDYLLSNFLYVRDDNSISIPDTRHFRRERHAKWELTHGQNLDSLIIMSKNKIFNRKFQVEYNSNTQILLLSSDSTQIKAERLLDF